MGTIQVFSGLIRPTTDSSYGDAGSGQSSTNSIGSTYCFFSPAAPCRSKTQNTAKKVLKKSR